MVLRKPDKPSLAARLRQKSVSVLRLNCGSCGGCDMELEAIFAPRYDAQQYGLSMTGSPKHADAVIVTGPVTNAMLEPLRRTLDQVPQPRVVVVLGSCGTGVAPFDGSYALAGAVSEVVPVDVFIGGCPPRPRVIIDGLVRASGLLGESRTSVGSVAGKEAPRSHESEKS